MATRVQSAPGNRWAIACAGVVVMIIAGTAYAWSNFTQPLVAAFGWSSTQASLIFGLAIFFIGVGAVVGGRWQDRIGPRTVTITGIVLWGIGAVVLLHLRCHRRFRQRDGLYHTCCRSDEMVPG